MIGGIGLGERIVCGVSRWKALRRFRAATLAVETNPVGEGNQLARSQGWTV
jgi:hypothetical protein